MILAELEVRHSRAIAPTRRVALGELYLPVDPAPGFGGLLLAGIVGAWFTSGRLWIWVALALLVLIAIYMSYRATPFFASVRAASGQPSNVRGKALPGGPPDLARIDQLLTGTAVPRELLLVGGTALAVIVWLMEVKPF